MEQLFLKPVDRAEEKMLLARGVNGGDFLRARDKSDLFDCLVKFETDIPRVLPKTVSVVKQISALERVLRKPLSSNYVLGISSFPSDARAKHLAIHIMNTAIAAWRVKHVPGKDLPRWHSVFGGLGDPLRDRPSDDMPALLVLSNLNDGSSNYKLEKVRDLLEKYAAIPRIVILGGSDPITFFGTKLHYPINAGLFIGPQNRIREDCA